MKINKISTKLIKPLTPTPQNLKNYHISFLDQHVVKKYIAVVLYYQSAPDNGRLEESLAETLVHFYPLAGRYIKTDLKVDCSDQGAEFIEAEAQDDVEVTDLIGKTDTIHLCPEQYFGLDEGTDDPLLSIQVTRFSCGGVTIAVSVSHRVFDVSSLETFLSAWSSASKTDGGVIPVIPSFALASLLPNKDEKFGLDSNKCQGKEQKIVVKRLLFQKEALARLKSERSTTIVSSQYKKLTTVVF